MKFYVGMACPNEVEVTFWERVRSYSEYDKISKFQKAPPSPWRF